MPKRNAPDRLYKYESLGTQTLRNLKRQIIYFGPPRDFNDPYDCALTPNISESTDVEVERVRKLYLSSESTPDQARRELEEMSTLRLRQVLTANASEVMRRATSEFLGNKGVTCFSELNDDLLMWSHYGGRYRGICLEFDVSLEPFSRVKPVKYLKAPPRLEPARLLFEDGWDVVEQLFCIKSKAWAYEREWRGIHEVAGTEFCYPTEALTGVYFGPDIEFASLEIVCLILQGQNPGVRLFQGERSTSEFKVLFKPFTYTSNAEAKARGLL